MCFIVLPVYSVLDVTEEVVDPFSQSLSPFLLLERLGDRKPSAESGLEHTHINTQIWTLCKLYSNWGRKLLHYFTFQQDIKVINVIFKNESFQPLQNRGIQLVAAVVLPLCLNHVHIDVNLMCKRHRKCCVIAHFEFLSFVTYPCSKRWGSKACKHRQWVQRCEVVWHI